MECDQMTFILQQFPMQFLHWVWFYGISTIVGYLMPSPFLYVKTVLFHTIQFSISIQFSFIWPPDRTLSVATTPVQCEPGSDSNKRVLRIPQSSSITGASPSDSLVSYPGRSWGESNPSAEMQSVYFYSPSRLGKVPTLLLSKLQSLDLIGQKSHQQ